MGKFGDPRQQIMMVNTRTDADLSAAVQNALQTLLPQIRAEIREEFRTSSGPSDAVEGNALAWWKAYKQAKGGDALLITVTWEDFKKLFFLQFFPRAEQERLKREYHSIRQTNTETSTEFIQHFLRLDGFLGAAAGTEEEQAKNFQWGLRRSTLNHLMCMSYTDVAQVANAARNYEILHERDDDDAKRPDKRRVVIGISRPLNRVVTGTTVIIMTVMDQTGKTNTKTSTEFMQRFLRLAGFLRAAAGIEEEQAKNFQWGLRRPTLNHLMCMSYTDVAQVANVARNYEILHERDDDDTERPDKRNSGYGRDQRNGGQQSNRSAISGNSS
nr:zinc finger, CCHC-type, retrotransposon Gag domain protein [Tanacetum cinerariifolium]